MEGTCNINHIQNISKEISISAKTAGLLSRLTADFIRAEYFNLHTYSSLTLLIKYFLSFQKIYPKEIWILNKNYLNKNKKKIKIIVVRYHCTLVKYYPWQYETFQKRFGNVSKVYMKRFKQEILFLTFVRYFNYFNY